ncbi:MAG: plasmid partitioning protein RepB [Leifsonia xyli]|nr:MAG: plasmid partitioning protein RepB [Leifsonia xyli]
MATIVSPDGRRPRATPASPKKFRSVETIVELSPSDIDPSFVPDRLVLGQDLDFVQFIKENGQLAPILVRPCPERPGRYQVVYGHRRLQAAAALGVKIRAVVRPLTDIELVIAQGQENAARKDLSFIERALFAAELEKRGFERQTIMDALIVDKAEVSRLIKIATQAPKDLLLAIGPARKAGRPRWEALLAHIQAPGGLTKARSFIKSSMFKTLYSDERFSELLNILENREPKQQNVSEIIVDEEALGSIKKTTTTTTFCFETAAAHEFADYLSGQLPELYRAWKTSRPA